MEIGVWGNFDTAFECSSDIAWPYKMSLFFLVVWPLPPNWIGIFHPDRGKWTSTSATPAAVCQRTIKRKSDWKRIMFMVVPTLFGFPEYFVVSIKSALNSRSAFTE